MNPLSRCFRSLLAVAVTLSLCLIAVTALAQNTNRQIGTQFEVTADPLVPRPHEKPCIVPLFANYQFAYFSATTQTFDFTPPSDCSGPWEKVVLDVDFSENAGDQFDRTASIYLGNTNVYFGTTPEPLQTATNTWHIERDVTDYSALLLTPQPGTMVLQNCTTDCPSPYNTELNGVFTVNAELEFYPAQGHGQSGGETPDVVLPLVQTTSGGINLPAYLYSATDQFSTTFTLPKNIERVYLDVIAQSQQIDEQWYACFPNDLSNINELYGCGNTDFRETEITIDGQPAGISPVSAWVFTGFLPDQWVPTPAAQTLDFVPYRVNLTPFAGVLSDGNPHTVSLSVFNANYYFTSTATLLLFLDHGSTHVTGAVTKNTLASPTPVVTENLQGTTTVTGTIGVVSNRDFTIAGYVNTSHGKVATSVWEEQNFSSTQTIDFDTVNFTVLDQNTSVHNRVSSTSTAWSNGGSVVTRDDFSFPITVDVIYPVSTAPFGLTVATTQNYQTDKLTWFDGFPFYFNWLTNSVTASDVSPAASSQKYTYFDSTGMFYDCQIASKNNTLTAVSQGCKPAQH
ncbi:Peptide-N(4)-(N-acetyl-beta-glucosaminyl)asparagine amidase [Candidatus Sulfotelmatobacter kueseliae]|uniref:Peptide-N(4)-(N-acetyl-beta-glucosaminyl)asparagine amidase n=1 Tax=Candidatus Sulfotelmatobacter kueseliae TaxID=2042962 RepID=A0A2U3LD85_9BACT|nr:Peptide-N(4)-(N-acetyl-beta-glucosaminyl)asparagine amidase [Candidatus Sulfotelmatobacter kueseliae]